jgi:hypothetical protein
MALVAGLAVATPGASGAFTAVVSNSDDTVATADYFTCEAAYRADSAQAYFQWALADPSGATTAYDFSGQGNPGTYANPFTPDTPGPNTCPRDQSAVAWKLNGTSDYAYSGTKIAAPNVFTIETYFRTSAKQGRLIGFGTAQTGLSANYDRQLYINTDGAITFGVYSNGNKTITSSAPVADDAWHHVAATMDAGGMALYVDGALQGTIPTTTSGEPTNGYWRVGYDSLTNWAKAPSTTYYKGWLRAVAVYTTPLTATQIRNHAAAMRGR